MDGNGPLDRLWDEAQGERVASGELASGPSTPFDMLRVKAQGKGSG